jgi:SAM-dependent methyltransferase
MDPLVAASLDAQAGSDEEFVERVFREILRRPIDDESRTRALGMLAEGTLSRSTFLHELVTAPEAERVREVDDAVAFGLGARARGERLAWLQAPGGTDERVVEIPWVLSRLVRKGRVLEAGYAYAEPVYLAGLLRTGVELVGADLAERDVEGMERIMADVRSLPLPDDSVDQVLLVSTLEHVGADNSGYGLDAEQDPSSRVDALCELGRVLRSKGTLLVTVPLGEPGDRGWFRLDDVQGWTRLFTSAGLFVEEQEAYELTGEGWRSAPNFRADGVCYGDRGPAASAVLCTELSPGRFRRLATPQGLARTVKRHARPWRHRAGA